MQNYDITAEELFSNCQTMLIDSSGILLESDDCLFDASKLHGASLMDIFPFLESVFLDLQALPEEKPQIKFSKIESPHEEYLKGYYDFTFLKLMHKTETVILWTIYDFTSLYEDLIAFQQKKNELEIQRMQLEFLQKNTPVSLSSKTRVK